MDAPLFLLSAFAFISSKRSNKSPSKSNECDLPSTDKIELEGFPSVKIDQDASAVLPDFHGGKIFKFILTGGPCGGKTTAIARLQGFLRERGFRVYIAPEAATIMFLNGVTVDDFSNSR